MELSVIHSYGEELERRLRLRTFPLAVKFVEREADIPEGAVRPLRDLGYHLPMCQGLAMSRRDGIMVAMLIEDMWCFEPVVGIGMAEAPEQFLEGNTRYPASAKTLKAGKNWATAFPCLSPGRYIGVVSAPLKTASFEPDLVVIYADSAQVTELVVAAVYKDGRDISSKLSGAAACVYSTVPVMQTGEYAVALPCGGDRKFGIAQDDELIFSAPMGKVEDLLMALRERERGGARLPLAFKMMREPELPPSFKECSKRLGMDV